MSTEHHIIVEAGRWPHPIAHPMQIGFLMRKYVHDDLEYKSRPEGGPVRTLQHNFEDRLRRAGAEFNPRETESKPHTYHLRVPEERLGEVVTLLQGHPAAASARLLHPEDGTEEGFKSVLALRHAPHATSLCITARFRLVDGEPGPCAEGDEPGPGDSCVLLAADGREKRYGGQAYLAELAGRPLVPGEEAVLLLHSGSLLPWVEELKRRYEDDIETYLTLRGSGVFFHAILPEHLHRLKHAVLSWDPEPMETVPAGLPDCIQKRKEMLEGMKYHCNRIAMEKHSIPGCKEKHRPLSAYDLVTRWQSRQYPWTAHTYHDGCFLTYRIDHDGTAHAWSLRHRCPVVFQTEA